ncbi:MAG: sugar nucleotide-binding protein [Alphaproteobacteria bacterium]|nr:sugar nucleotide-binding protein [Alphaproteobacteria bacterium]
MTVHPQPVRAPLELWGGVECTVVRVGHSWRNQIAETGHATRLGDLDAIAALGIKAIRYPIVWETVAPDRPGSVDFGWHDARLERLRALGIRVVAGLVHHGSGPRYTNLLDRDFAAKLGDYAARVAARYPWIDDWTPVNEPLTTARFACLYGHWYPHKRSYRALARAIVNECEGTRRAMAAIRAVNPSARLLQTEDLGKTFATPRLAYQARHENLRRWLSLDLLTGRIGPDHHWWELLQQQGVAEAELDAFQDGSGRPDILGINHYLTSERYLDERLDRYPGIEPGGNRRHRYVDLEAVRIPELAGETGPAERLREAWERYRIPMVVSEVHHGCTREEQLRWLAEVWDAAETVRGEGVDLRAVTLWSLMGAVDWRSLITRREGVYDVGAFDVRGPAPRPTLVARAATQLAAGGRFEHPVLETPGWWHRPERVYGAAAAAPATAGRPLLITGATGTLGRAFARLAEHRGLAHVLTPRVDLDITDEASIEAAIARLQPWAIVNTAGFVRVADAEQERDACFRANTTGPERLAAACARHGLPLVTFSSDLVFDGQLGRPYLETDPARPTSVYGASKAAAEQRVLDIWPETLVVRTSAFFGPWDRYNFVWDTMRRLNRGEIVEASDAAVVSPTYVPDLVHATLDLLLDGESGLWHLANEGAVSWRGLAERAAEGAGLDASLIRTPERWAPANTALSSARGLLLRKLEPALEDWLQHCALDWREAA